MQSEQRTEKIKEDQNGFTDPNPPSPCSREKLSKMPDGKTKEVMIMLVPSIFGENLFDDWFDFPQWPDFNKMEKKLYGRRADHLMKTDVHEHEDHYEVDIDLPGFKKDEIELELKNGYLVVSAAKEHEQENPGKAIRKERYSGSMQRSFYVGEQLTEEDIKAKFEHGVLSLEVPKKDTPKIPEKKTIMIEG